MKKTYQRILLGAAIVVLALFILYKYNISQTKKHSPEANVEYTIESTQISVFYNRPYKKGREIFGNLVPYNEVWRTGANEATTFTTTGDLTIAGNELPEGKYTLWTIPGPEKWTVIFNSKMYPWGVSLKDGKASRDPAHDVLSVEIPVINLDRVVEQFTISFGQREGNVMLLQWDSTEIAIPVQGD